jgi:23S rRNA (adenine2503-C2)-methyltransferase
MDKKDIKNFTIDEFKKELSGFLIPSYRAGQLFGWVYKKIVWDFSEMSDIPSDLREKLARKYYIGHLRLKDRSRSSDGTEKFLFELFDSNFIEAVLIRSGERSTLCISTQAGCKYACAFCASGSKGFIRDLSSSEIVDQVLSVQKITGGRINNLVFMGMGEPMDNYDNVAKAIIIINSHEGIDIGSRKITVSTCGIIPGIEKFSDIGLQANLSLSLHAADNKKRNSLMPVNKKFPLEDLIEACEKFVLKSGRKITLEYVLIKGKNDSMSDADGLSAIAGRLKAKVNLIPCSPVLGKSFSPPPRKEINQFRDRLTANKISVTVRESKGGDIKAACGQLAMQK